MTVQLLETQVFKGKEYVAVHTPDDGLCYQCALNVSDLQGCATGPYQMPCAASDRTDKKSVIWLTPEHAALARLRGHL